MLYRTSRDFTRPSQLTWAESPRNWQLPSTSNIATVIITQPISWYSFHRPTEGGRPSRPRHCSKGAQPVPKTAYRSSCRHKHNCPRCDSNLGPLTPQSDALTTQRPDLSTMRSVPETSTENANFINSKNSQNSLRIFGNSKNATETCKWSVYGVAWRGVARRGAAWCGVEYLRRRWRSPANTRRPCSTSWSRTPSSWWSSRIWRWSWTSGRHSVDRSWAIRDPAGWYARPPPPINDQSAFTHSQGLNWGDRSARSQIRHLLFEIHNL